MSEELHLRYLDNPEKYCDSVNVLIENGSDKWQKAWKAAIPDLFQNPDLLESPAHNINAINFLLKVIEKAFKERVYRIRVQAFECWQYFILTVEHYEVSDKLLNVVLIPLCASNHSMYEVLQAKLKTFDVLLDSNLISKPVVLKKSIPNLLKILYGPHGLRPATEFDDLIELSGKMYIKMMEKCLPYEMSDILFTYLEKAIPVLSKNENTQNIAKEIWRNALEHISCNNWPTVPFNHLMKTFENLISNNRSENKLVSELLSVLIKEYGTFPSRYLTFHMRLITRCSFISLDNDALNNMLECLLKKCKNEDSFFKKIGPTLDEFADEHKDKLQKYWISVTNCFLKWFKNSVPEDCNWILDFPVKHLHVEWNSAITEQIQSCYDKICSSNNGNMYIKNLLQKLCTFLEKFENVPVSFLNASVALIKIILQCSRNSVNADGICSVRFILQVIFEKVQSQNMLTDGSYKSFTPKFVATVLFFMEAYPNYANEFTPVIQKYSHFANNDKKDGIEMTVIQLMSKYNNFKNEENSNDSVFKFCSNTNVSLENKCDTPGKVKKAGFLARLSPVDNRHSIAESPRSVRIINMLKSKKPAEEDNDVQFIAIKSKPKNSPMTEHQKEKARRKSYIPPLYEDLSQSQSQSQSLPDSTLSPTIKTSTPTASIEYFEENANLPSENDVVSKHISEIPDSVSFCNYSDSKSKSDKSNFVFASKKLLFHDNLNPNDQSLEDLTNSISERKIENVKTDSICEKDEIPGNGIMSDKQVTKRKYVKSENKIDLTPLKRSKRMIEKFGEHYIKKCESNMETEVNLKPRLRGRSRKSVENVDALVINSRPRGRPRKSEGKMDSAAINLTDSESQTLFVTPTRLNKSLAISSPLNSLMDIKNSEDSAKMRRKSLKSKANDLSVRSPISTRKRKSSLMNEFKNKKVVTSDASEMSTELTSNILSENINDNAKTENTTPVKDAKKVQTASVNNISTTTSNVVLKMFSKTEIQSKNYDSVAESGYTPQSNNNENKNSLKTRRRSNNKANSFKEVSDIENITMEETKEIEENTNFEQVMFKEVVIPDCNNENIEENNSCDLIQKPSNSKTNSLKKVPIIKNVTVEEANEIEENTESDQVICKEVLIPDCNNENIEENNSVIIIENELIEEIISIVDSESPPVLKEDATSFKEPKVILIPTHDIVDESTYCENVEEQERLCMLENVNSDGELNNQNDKENKEIDDSVKLVNIDTSLQINCDEENSVSNVVTEQSRNEILIEKNVENSSTVDKDENKSLGEAKDSDTNSAIITDKSIIPEEVPVLVSIETNASKEISSPDNSSSDKKNVTEKKDDKLSPEKSNESNDNYEKDVFENSKKDSSQISDKNDHQQIEEDESKINTSPISSNTRTIKIMRLACDSQNVTKSKNSNKISKSMVIPSLSNIKTTSTNQRTLKILNMDKPRSSLSKIITTPTEILKNVGKECISPGILKRPDLNGSLSSPKSAKFVNFAEQLTDTRTYDVEEENYDSSDSEDHPSNNLLGENDTISQDILYSPLNNCKDDVNVIIERLSLGKQARNLFHRMGIETVGHLASVSTITAKSIPAGDNRLQRLRKALQEYEGFRTSQYQLKGLRPPSARKRIVFKNQENKLEVSSIIELLDEIETKEDRGSDNSLHEEDAIFEDILYSPLNNCTDDVNNILEGLSLSKEALNIFYRMGIETVGHLASVSVSSAERKPASHNRIQELRKALQEYEKFKISQYQLKGLRPPSARKRILFKNQENKLEVSSIIDLLDEIETKQDASSNIENRVKNVLIQNCLPKVEITKLDAEFCASIINKSRSPTKSGECTESVIKNLGYELFDKSSKNDSVQVELMKEDNERNGLSNSSNDDKRLKNINNEDEDQLLKINNDEDELLKDGDDSDELLRSDDDENQSLKNDNGIEINAASVATEVNINPDMELSPKVVSNVMKNVTDDQLNDGAAEDKSVEKNFVQIEDITQNKKMECNIVEKKITNTPEIRQDLSDDSDFICTANDESDNKSANLNTYSRLAAARISMAASLHSPFVHTSSSNVITSSPEIISVEMQDLCSEVDEHNDSEKENSVSIFSSDVTNRSVNDDGGETDDTDIEHQVRSSSPLLNSKNPCDERLTSDAEKTIIKISENQKHSECEVECEQENNTYEANKDSPQSSVSRSQTNVYQQIMFSILEPFLSKSLLEEVIIPNEQKAENNFSKVLQRLSFKVEELDIAGYMKPIKEESGSYASIFKDLSRRFEK